MWRAAVAQYQWAATPWPLGQQQQQQQQPFTLLLLLRLRLPPPLPLLLEALLSRMPGPRSLPLLHRAWWPLLGLTLRCPWLPPLLLPWHLLPPLPPLRPPALLQSHPRRCSFLCAHPR